MSNERDELAVIIDDLMSVNSYKSEAIAADLIAAGYRKPRTLTTAAELDSLRSGSVVLTTQRTPGFPWRKGPAGWRAGLSGRAVPSPNLMNDGGPLLLIHEPAA